MRSGRQRRCRGYIEEQHSQEIVVVLQLAIVHVQAPSAHVAALGDNHAFDAGSGYFDFRSNRVRLVLRMVRIGAVGDLTTSH